MNLKLRKSKSDTADAAGQPVKKKKRGKKRWKLVLILVLVLVILAACAWYFLGRGSASADASSSAYSIAEVTRGNITATITGSGTLEAADSYTVTTLIEGTILTADFEEGDQVEADTVLYTIDSSGASKSLEQSQISLNQAQRNYASKLEDLEDLTVTASVAGRVLTLDVEVGDDVTAGQQVATIRNYDTMTLTVAFPADDADSFYVGQSATVTLDSTFETLSGTVSEIAANTTVLSGNMIVRNVTIDVSNPGGLSTTQTASAEINGVGSSASASFAYKDEGTVTASISGTVESISVSEGDWVNKNATILTLSSDTLSDEIQSASDSLRNAEISYENQTENLDDYTITSPIQGTIVDKYYNAGETTEANQTLCTIYDLSYLTMTLSVDELDIASIAVGQTVTITADAVDGVSYEGVVTKVSVAGTSSGSATTYPVTIRIDETDGLLPGMSVDATIELESAEDVLIIPAAALNRGNTVLITADSPSAEGVEVPATGDGDGENAASQYVSVEVTTGVSSDDYIEVTSGLQEGDVVVYIPTSSSSDSGFAMMGGMQGGMGGGMGGGMPGGF